MDQDLKETLIRTGQEHILEYAAKLKENPQQLAALVNDLKSIDLDHAVAIFKSTVLDDESSDDNSQSVDELLEPLNSQVYQSVKETEPEVVQKYYELGLREIAQGNVAVLLLAGGQGTRLGVSYPKGRYAVGLPSGKTLYQIQAERIIRLEQLAASAFPEVLSNGTNGGTNGSNGSNGSNGNGINLRRGTIPWYIMTSEHTMAATEKFFEEHNYFNLCKDNLIFFEQNTLPCFTLDGKIIMDTATHVARSPDGNGGLYRALRDKGILQDMTARGVQYVHVYCVDNILVKMADPVFVGYALDRGAEAAAKTVEKDSPHEAVGIICRVSGKYQVVEYSEVSSATAERQDPDGKLSFRAGNICNHFFSVPFLNRVANGPELKHHIAKKKIPFTDILTDGQRIVPTKPNGIKLEKFVFDVFEFTDKFAVWDVLREDEFSPLKNAEGAAKDTPSTARRSLYDLHRRYIARAGGNFVVNTSFSSHALENGNRLDNGHAAESQNGNSAPQADQGQEEELICEISPLVSYAGEGLEALCAGKTFTSPLIILAEAEQLPSKELANGNALNGNGTIAEHGGEEPEEPLGVLRVDTLVTSVTSPKKVAPQQQQNNNNHLEHAESDQLTN